MMSGTGTNGVVYFVHRATLISDYAARRCWSIVTSDRLMALSKPASLRISVRLA